MQRDMVELRDVHKYSNHRIADETGIARSTVINWLAAADEQGVNVDPHLTPRSVQAKSDRAVAKRVITGDPGVVKALFDEVPYETQRQIADELAASPVIRMAAQRREYTVGAHREPREQPGETLTMYQFASRLHTAYISLRQAHDLLVQVDRTEEEDPNVTNELDRRVKWLREHSHDGPHRPRGSRVPGGSDRGAATLRLHSRTLARLKCLPRIQAPSQAIDARGWPVPTATIGPLDIREILRAKMVIVQFPWFR